MARSLYAGLAKLNDGAALGPIGDARCSGVWRPPLWLSLRVKLGTKLPYCIDAVRKRAWAKRLSPPMWPPPPPPPLTPPMVLLLPKMLPMLLCLESGSEACWLVGPKGVRPTNPIGWVPDGVQQTAGVRGARKLLPSERVVDVPADGFDAHG